MTPDQPRPPAGADTYQVAFPWKEVHCDVVAQRTTKKWQLGREIQHMITEAGLTQTQAAEVIETRQSRIADLIEGKATITVGDLNTLANACGFTEDRYPGYQDFLRELRRDNHKRGFWTTGYMRAFLEDFRLMVDMERKADRLRTAEVEIMPGLVQCEAYIRAIHEYTGPSSGDVSVEEQVQARLSRQDVLTGEGPPEFHAVLSESCLRRVYGGPEVMREQIAHVITLSRQPNVLIQIVPFSVTPARALLLNRFLLVRVPTRGLAGPLELAYTEHEGDIRYVDDKKVLAARESTWARLSAAALNAEDTRKYLQHVAGTFQ